MFSKSFLALLFFTNMQDLKQPAHDSFQLRIKKTSEKQNIR